MKCVCYSKAMSFWIFILIVVVLVIALVVAVVIGSDTGDDQEGYTVSDDEDDAHYDASTGITK